MLKSNILSSRTTSLSLLLLVSMILLNIFIIGVLYLLVIPEFNLIDRNIKFRGVGWVFESLVLTFVMLLIYVLCKRRYLAVIITLLLYLGFITSNIIKIKILATPLYPADLNLIGDLFKTWQVFKEFLPYLLLFIFTLFIIIYIGISKEHTPKNIERLRIRAIIFIILTLFSSITFQVQINDFLKSNGIYHKPNTNLVKSGLKYGFLSNFTQVAIFAPKQTPPANYSYQSILNIVNRHALNEGLVSREAIDSADNVIVLLVESFTNPDDFGWNFSNDPIPSFNSIIQNHSSGHVISPVYGGKSINAEFELLTGLTNRFTPVESVPYKEFVRPGIPSLARIFKQNGYITNAIQVIEFKGFGYSKIYEYLGIDNKISLSTKTNPELKPDPSGRSTSNTEIAKKIISLTRAQNKSFIFAFPNSSHSPWKMEHYPKSDIHLSNSTMDIGLNDTISAYANALNHDDLLLKLLIENFESRLEEKTIIVLLGDHQPGFNNYGMNQATQLNTFYEEIINKYQVPIGIWSNYQIQKDKRINASINFIPSYLIEASGLPLNGFMKFNYILSKEFSYISHIIETQANSNNKLTDKAGELIKEYKLIQYDTLFGKNYFDQIMNQY